MLQKLKVKNKLRKKIISSTDDETDTNLSDIDKAPAILHVNRLQDDSDSGNETNKNLPTPKRKSRLIESESDEDPITDSIDNQNNEIPNSEISKKCFERKVSYDERKLGTDTDKHLNDSDNENFITPSKKKTKAIVSDEESEIVGENNTDTSDLTKQTNISTDNIKGEKTVACIIENSLIVAETSDMSRKGDIQREIDQTQTNDCIKSTSTVKDTDNEVKYDNGKTVKTVVDNNEIKSSDKSNAVCGEVQVIEVGKNELEENMALAADWLEDFDTEDDVVPVNCNSHDRLGASNSSSSGNDDDNTDGNGDSESSSDDEIDYSNLSSRVRVGKLKQLKKKEKLFEQFRLSRQRRLSKESNKSAAAV